LGCRSGFYIARLLLGILGHYRKLSRGLVGSVAVAKPSHAVMYVLPMTAFLAFALTSARWPRIGGALHFALALFSWWFFSGLAAFQFITVPLALLGACYWVGRPEPRKWAYRLIAILPPIVLVVCGIEPAIRVMGRVDDGNRGARLVEGNGVELIWAPAGPGWPTDGVTWHEANRRCRHLTADGSSLADAPQDVWRLPTADETVRSLCRHGENAGGTLDSAPAKPRYTILPDKESPLWDTRSQVIYWWTSTERDPDRALMVSFNGYVKPLPKKFAPGYLGFRAVKDPSRSENEKLISAGTRLRRRTAPQSSVAGAGPGPDAEFPGLPQLEWAIR
jgi:hypothetical protein